MIPLATAGWAENPHSMLTVPLAFMILVIFTVLGILLVAWLESGRSSKEEAPAELSARQFTLTALFQITLGASMWLALIKSTSLLQVMVLWSVLLILYVWHRKWHVLLLHGIFPATTFATMAIIVLLTLSVAGEPIPDRSASPLPLLSNVFWLSGVISFPAYFTRLPKSL